MKSKYSITQRWEAKVEEMKKKADFKFNILLQNKKRKIEKNWEYECEKMERKKLSYIRKKEEEYRRKCANEIREFEWRPKREYKSDAPKIKPLEFAMSIAQENAKLRDTDADGYGRCISCNKRCGWGELAWWHRYSRRFQNICLEPENINAQCHTCNFTTGPRWDTLAKEKTNQVYDINLDKKFWEWTAKGLAKKVADYFQWRSTKYDLEMVIPSLIEQNKKLWATKNFYAPWKKWENIWNKYITRTKSKNT